MAAQVNLAAGWIAILIGVVAGAIIGLFFHEETWLGGYASYPRRLVRLGHIAFFGLGFVNILFALTLNGLAAYRNIPGGPLEQIASIGMLAGLVTMPICCFLCAWRKPFRHLFPIPVAAVLIGTIALLIGWWTQ